MGIIEIIFLGLALGMDASAVALSKGLSMKKINWKKAIIIALYFGIFQGIMPIIGFFIGTKFNQAIINIDSIISFLILFLIGLNMIIEGVKKDNSNKNDDTSIKTLTILAIATSIDALAVGITIAFLKNNIILPSIIIGIITFILSLIGVKIGNIFGEKLKDKAEIIGGIILIIIAFKILIN